MTKEVLIKQKEKLESQVEKWLDFARNHPTVSPHTHINQGGYTNSHTPEEVRLLWEAKRLHYDYTEAMKYIPNIDKMLRSE